MELALALSCVRLSAITTLCAVRITRRCGWSCCGVVRRRARAVMTRRLTPPGVQARTGPRDP